MKPAKGKVTMSKEDFKKEHKNLVRILKTGSKKEQVKEANDQAKELKKVNCTCSCDKCQSLNKSKAKCNCSCKECSKK